MTLKKNLNYQITKAAQSKEMAAATTTATPGQLPEGFVDLKEVDPTILHSLRYINEENFTGVPVPGYNTSRVIVTNVLAQKLKTIQEGFLAQGYSLVVYDSYRPQKAIEHFWQWSQRPNDLLTADKYYPSFKDIKPVLFEQSYIARKSNHNRGSTLDVTLIKLPTTSTDDDGAKKFAPTSEAPLQKEKVFELQMRDLHSTVEAREATAAANGNDNTDSAEGQQEAMEGSQQQRRLLPYLEDGTLDMGTSVDLLDEASCPDAPLSLVPEPYHSRRQLLRRAFEAQGFTVSEREWWHYWLNNGEEPFPPGTLPFDFDI